MNPWPLSSKRPRVPGCAVGRTGGQHGSAHTSCQLSTGISLPKSGKIPTKSGKVSDQIGKALSSTFGLNIGSEATSSGEMLRAERMLTAKAVALVWLPAAAAAQEAPPVTLPTVEVVAPARSPVWG